MSKMAWNDTQHSCISCAGLRNHSVTQRVLSSELSMHGVFAVQCLLRSRAVRELQEVSCAQNLPRNLRDWSPITWPDRSTVTLPLYKFSRASLPTTATDLWQAPQGSSSNQTHSPGCFGVKSKTLAAWIEKFDSPASTAADYSRTGPMLRRISELTTHESDP